MATKSVIKGAVTLVNLPDVTCFETYLEMLQSLVTYLGIEIPVDDISNVVISNQQPGIADINKLWVRRANSGQMLGIYVFTNGKWIALTPAANQVFWFYGDSRSTQPGYKLIESNSGIFTSAEYALLEQQYIRDPSNTYFVYYAAIFVGV